MDSAVQLKLDPWSSDVEAVVAISVDDAQSPPPIDVRVETTRWQAIDPTAAAAKPAPSVFIDGVRRVDARLLATIPGGHAFGLLGSFAIGAVRAGEGAPHILQLETGRLLILGRGYEHPGVNVNLPGGGGALPYRPMAVPSEDPDGPLLELQAAMRRCESELAQALAGGSEPDAPAALAQLSPDTLIVADGPLAYLERTPAPLVGMIKSLQRAYLPAPERDLLPRLRPGQRTPIFAILDRNQRYSWYLRLGLPGPAEHELAGIARLECSSHDGLQAARAIADRAAATLGRFASSRTRDPRSPQNLVPIGGLEAVLRHRLGDRALIRRAILAELAGEPVAASSGEGR